MWRNDIRLRGLTDLINETHLRKYEDAVAEHPYTGLSAVIDWLTLQVAEVLLARASAPPRAAISSILADGDGHYAEVFSRLKLLSTERDESLPVEPLSYSVDKILEALTGRRMRGEEVSTVYGYLEEALLSGMAIRLASDNRFYGYEHWLSLTERFRQSRSFYGVLLNHIPETAIQEHAAELAAPYDPDNVVRYLSQADKRMEAEAYQLDYLKRQEDHKDKSPALYIDQLTKGADLMNLSEREELKKHLLALTGRTAELKWLDALRWPLAQAAALNSYRDVDELEALIAELVIQREQLQSPFVHLLLIISDRYFEVMRQISFNLRQFGQPLGHHYMEPAIAQKLHSEGAARLLQWKTSDIQHSLSRLFDNLRLIAAPKEAFHRGLFGWVAAQDRERWLENPHAELILLMIDELHTQYLAAFKPGGWLKGDLLRAVAPDALSWRSFKLLYSLWQTDESDSDLRQALREQMTGFVESADFLWNNAYAFDNDHLRQALHFTNLFIDSYPNFGTLQALTSLHRVWHEGWAYSGAAGIKNTNRYIFY